MLCMSIMEAMHDFVLQRSTLSPAARDRTFRLFGFFPQDVAEYAADASDNKR